MVGSDIGDINSPTHAGSRPTRVDPKLFGKPSDFSGDRREWRHFEWYFVTGLCSSRIQLRSGWTRQQVHLENLEKRSRIRRETDKALYMSLAMVCKNEALDVVKTVTHKRGFESWRKSSKKYIGPGAEAVRLHNLTRCSYQSWCEVCVASKGRSDHYHREAPQPMDGDVARIQMYFMFVGAEGTFADEPRARATVLMVICKDDGNLSATEVRSKTHEYGVEMVLRFLSTNESVEIKTDGETSIVEIALESTSST